MRINPDKLNKLAHTVADTLADIDEVGFLEDRNTIRQEARKALTALLTEEARIDQAARLKIANQRKIILEGLKDDADLVIDAVFERQLFNQSGGKALLDDGQLVGLDHLGRNQVFAGLASEVTYVVLGKDHGQTKFSILRGLHLRIEMRGTRQWNLREWRLWPSMI